MADAGPTTHVGQAIVPALVIVPPVSGEEAVMEVTVPDPAPGPGFHIPFVSSQMSTCESVGAVVEIGRPCS